MRVDHPLVGAVLFLGAGLGLIIAYCHGTTGLNAAYPLSGSSLHLELTINGPAVIGGLSCLVMGALLLIWAFFVGLISVFAGSDQPFERIVERERYDDPSLDTSGYSGSILPREPKEHGHEL